MNEIEKERAEQQRLVTEHQHFQEQFTRLLQQGSELLTSGQTEQACSLFQELKQKVSDFYGVWQSRLLEVAKILGMEGAWDDQSIAQDQALPLLLIGQARRWAGSLEEAEQSLREALRVLDNYSSPFKAAACNELAEVYSARSSYSEAERYFRQSYEEYAGLDLWEQAVQVLSARADCLYLYGKREDFFNCLLEALRLAERHNLDRLHRDLRIRKYFYRLSSDPTGKTLQEIEDERFRLKSLSQDADFQADLETLIADHYTSQGILPQAEKRLLKALGYARGLTSKRWSVLFALARLYRSQGRIDKALSCGEEALQIARSLDQAEMGLQLLPLLIPLRTMTEDPAQQQQAAKELGLLRSLSRSQELTAALLDRALVFAEKQQYELSLADAEEALQYAPTADFRCSALAGKTFALQAMQRYREALAANLLAIDVVRQELISAGKTVVIKWRDLLERFAALHCSAAVLSARLGQIRQAFDYAESSKAQLLKEQLALAGLQPGIASQPLAPVHIEQVQDWLSSQSAAMVVFCVGLRDTLALVLNPREQEPKAYFTGLSGEHLNALLTSRSTSAESWNQKVFGALDELSAKLLAPLQDVVKSCKLLYIVPDSRLYLVPFAGLVFPDGTALIDHCALSHVPSAAVWNWCQSRQRERRERNCLAVGIGVESDLSFSEQARAIVEGLPWSGQAFLLDSDATVKRFLNLCRDFAVVHVSCHSNLEDTMLESLAASRLEFYEGQKLTARDVIQLQGELNAELVFLNACTSGRFKLQMNSEVGGFWEAFLAAGAASLIATLSYVDPLSAQMLARQFYREWLSGEATKAEALRRAQLWMRSHRPEPEHWATHILIGDHR